MSKPTEAEENNNASDPAAPGRMQELEAMRSVLERQNEELRRNQTALDEARRRYSYLFDFAPVGYCTLDEDKRILQANLTLAGMLELERATLPAQSLTRFVDPDYLDVFQFHCGRIWESGGRESCELMLRMPAGGSFFARLDSVLMYDVERKADVMHMTIIDQSEQKQIAAELLEIQRLGKIASFKWDLRTGVMAWSPEFYVIVERAQHEIPHTLGGCLSLVHPDDRNLVMDSSNAAIAGEREQFIEYRVLTPDGRTKWIVTLGRVHFDAEGRKPLYMLGYAQDITERKLAEADRQRLQGQLLQAQKMESIGHLASGVAHDFNNILQTIIGHAQMLENRCAGDAVGMKHISGIRFSVMRASDLTRGLLAFGRKQSMTFERVDLNALVQETSRLLGRILGEDIELTTLLSDEPLIVMADGTQMQQALVSLATNARDSMPQGGRLFVNTSLVDVTRGEKISGLTDVHGRYAVVSISDTGAGIDDRDKARIFEPFYPSSRDSRGTGLGLAAVYGIVKQHGGTIDVSGAKGAGTTFRLYLPMTPFEELPEREDVESEVVKGQGTILLAEDDASVRETLKEILESLGYVVLLASDGQEAVDLFEHFRDKIDLVILDIVMPRMNGREASEQMKRISPSVRTIFMSGYNADMLAQRSIISRDVNFVLKPVTLQELSGRIRAVLGR